MTISAEARAALRILVLFGIPAILGACGGEPVPREMGETIEMGPFVFAVEGTTETFRRDDKEIDIRFSLDQERSEPFRETFGEAFFTALEIVDDAGNRFEPRGFGAIDGSRLSAREWEARFVLSPKTRGVRDRENLGEAASDFRLIIENPDRRASQPRRVGIRLE